MRRYHSLPPGFHAAAATSSFLVVIAIVRPLALCPLCLSREPLRYLGDVGLEEDTGVGSAGVHSAIQRLRAQLAKIYAARKKKKKESKLAGDDVVITVSSEGITVIDTGNQETLSTIILDAVCYTR